MIERLMNSEAPYDNPEYSQTTKRIVEIRHQMEQQLDQAGCDLLDQLASTYLEQSHILIRDAFVGGFCAAAEVTLEIVRHKSP